MIKFDKSRVVRSKECDTYLNIAMVRPLPVDQYPCEEFNLGLNGLPASDLTLLERAQSSQEVERILSRLNEIKSSTKSSMTDREIVQSIVPRWCQSPAELDKFMDYYYNEVVEPTLTKQADVVTPPDQDGADTPPVS